MPIEQVKYVGDETEASCPVCHCDIWKVPGSLSDVYCPVCWVHGTLSSNGGKEGDFVVHPIIRVDGDKATGKWLIYLMYCYPRTGQSLFWVQGFYDMDYVRENEKWKISVMRWTERMGLPGTGPPTGLF